MRTLSHGTKCHKHRRRRTSAIGAKLDGREHAMLIGTRRWLEIALLQALTSVEVCLRHYRTRTSLFDEVPRDGDALDTRATAGAERVSYADAATIRANSPAEQLSHNREERVNHPVYDNIIGFETRDIADRMFEAWTTRSGSPLDSPTDVLIQTRNSCVGLIRRYNVKTYS